MEYIRNFQKRKSNSKITFCNPETAVEKQKALQEHLNNKRTKLTTEENEPSKELLTTTSNLMETESTVASTSNAAANEGNTSNIPPDNPPKEKTNWADDAMNLDKNISAESGEFANTLETLNSAAADAPKNQSESSTAKGKNAEKGSDDHDFIQVPCITKFRR